MSEPQLYVTNVDAAIDYYCGTLGFTLAFAWGTPSHYAMVARDAARLCLRKVCEPVYVGDIRERLELLAASITVPTRAELDHLHTDFVESGADVYRDTQVQPWGAANFIIRDPDGNLILFASPAS